MKNSRNLLILLLANLIFGSIFSYWYLKTQYSHEALSVIKIGSINGEKIESLQSLFWRLHNNGLIANSLNDNTKIFTQPIDESTGVIKVSSKNDSDALDNLNIIIKNIIMDHNNVLESSLQDKNGFISNSNSAALASKKSKNFGNVYQSRASNEFENSARKTMVIMPPKVVIKNDKYLIYKSLFFGLLLAFFSWILWNAFEK